MAVLSFAGVHLFGGWNICRKNILLYYLLRCLHNAVADDGGGRLGQFRHGRHSSRRWRHQLVRITRMATTLLAAATFHGRASCKLTLSLPLPEEDRTLSGVNYKTLWRGSFFHLSHRWFLPPLPAAPPCTGAYRRTHLSATGVPPLLTNDTSSLFRAGSCFCTSDVYIPFAMVILSVLIFRLATRAECLTATIMTWWDTF